MPSIELLKALRAALLREQKKRAKQRGWPLGSDPRLALYQRLDEMAARRRAIDGPLPRLTPAQKADLSAFLLAAFGERQNG